MAQNTIRVVGMKEALAGLEDLNKATARAVLNRVLKKAATPAMEAAKRLVPQPGSAPYATGELRDSIVMKVSRSNAGKRAFAQAMAGGATRAEAGQAARDANRAAAGRGLAASVTVRATAPHAVLVEYGSARMKERDSFTPFMRPAHDTTADKAVKIMASEMSVEIEKSARRAAARAAKTKGG